MSKRLCLPHLFLKLSVAARATHARSPGSREEIDKKAIDTEEEPPIFEIFYHCYLCKLIFQIRKYFEIF